MENKFENKFEEFVSASTPESQKVYKCYPTLGEFDYIDCDIELVEKAIQTTKPKKRKAITTVCNVLKRYAEYLGDTHLIRLVNSIDRTELWERIKPDDVRKFISHKQYESICHDIAIYEPYNSLYYETLFMAIYEGIYTKDMSVLINLRASDINRNTVSISPDGKEGYPFIISMKLIHNLRELSEVVFWEQRVGYGKTSQQPLVGNNMDDCFKTVVRKNREPVRFYYKRLEKIAKDYVEYPLNPYELFISGLVYRISEQLNEQGFTLQEAFEYNKRNKEVYSIVKSELERSHYTNAVNKFRELIVDYLDVFTE